MWLLMIHYISPTEILSLPLNTSPLDDKQSKYSVPDSSDFNMKEESFIEPHTDLDNIHTFVSEVTCNL